MTTESSLRLRPPRHRVSRRAIRWWITQAAIGTVVVLVPAIIALLVWDALRPWGIWLVAAVAAYCLVDLVVMPQWRFRVHRWEVTEDAVYTAAGWLNQEWRVAPMSRIQTVDMQRGPLQQLFGIATVTVTTASAAGPLKIEGLDHDVATELVEQLTEVTQATRGDAT